MNERIQELAEQAEIKFESHPQHQGVDTAVIIPTDLEKFALLIVKECINNLEFHGFDDAVPYIKWMATNNLGVKE